MISTENRVSQPASQPSFVYSGFRLPGKSNFNTLMTMISSRYNHMQSSRVALVPLLCVTLRRDATLNTTAFSFSSIHYCLCDGGLNTGDDNKREMKMHTHRANLPAVKARLSAGTLATSGVWHRCQLIHGMRCCLRAGGGHTIRCLMLCPPEYCFSDYMVIYKFMLGDFLLISVSMFIQHHARWAWFERMLSTCAVRR